MPVEVKPLFRLDVLGPRLRSFALPESATAAIETLTKWRDLLWTADSDKLKEQELLPDFLSDVFGGVLGYRRPVDNPQRYTLSQQKHVVVDGKYADAVLGEFTDAGERFVVAVEGKGPTDPLDRPFRSRKMSAVDQGYRYAINLPCDWIIVTSMRETRLYYKGADQLTFERFVVRDLVESESRLKKFVYLLSAERVVPESGECHLDELRTASDKVGRDLTKDYYLRYAEVREDVFEQLCAHNPDESRHAVLSVTQKVLDRVLFCAFCEDRNLLPGDTLQEAFEHSDPYNPRPVWENFRGLFRSIDQGNQSLKIPAYNGGLFAGDEVLDRLTVPDAVCRHFKDLGQYEYRRASDVTNVTGDSAETIIDVDILGHIFEQSISDLEHLRNELDGLVPPAGKEKHKTRRKKEGAFYTPAFITRYIVEQALGGVLADRFEQLRSRHQQQATGTARRVLDDPNVYHTAALNEPQRRALTAFWEAWQDELRTIRILDPAVGSGAFLIEAFDQLHTVYETSNDRLEELRGHRTLFDLDREILQNNLYGVDINEEAIQICRLSLWIKTAARGKQLTSLDHNIRVGNSVVDDPEVHPLAFDWDTAFPEVTKAGGFDVVVSNPPYIRQEWIKHFKSHWESSFSSYVSTADIYVYFYELGVQRLRRNGRLGFITSGSWMRGTFGSGLRAFLANHSKIESIIDFGEYQPFEGAEMIRPTVTILRNEQSTGSVQLFRWLVHGSPPENLSEVIATSPTFISDRLSKKSWELEPDNVIAIREKMRSCGVTLDKYTGGNILYGVKTGLNDVFVIGPELKNRLIAKHESSAAVIHPFIQGTHLRPWYIRDNDSFLVFTRRGIDIEKYPAVHDYLAEHRERLEPKPKSWPKGSPWKGRKPGAYKWYEIQDSVDYWRGFEQPKIVWPDISKLPRFSMDYESRYLGNTGYVIPGEDYYLLGVLSSWATWFFISKTAQPLRLRGGRWQYRLIAQFMVNIPIPGAFRQDKSTVADLARTCTDVGQRRYAWQQQFRHRLRSSFGESTDGEPLGKLNNKATAWWELNLKQLGAALKTSFKLPSNPFASPRVADEWEPYLAEKKAEVDRLSRQLADAEAELNDRVFHLFALTPDEIKLLQSEVEH